MSKISCIVAAILALCWAAIAAAQGGEDAGMQDAWQQQTRVVKPTKQSADPVQAASLSAEEPTATQGGLSLSPLNSYLEDCGAPVRLKPDAVWDRFTTLLVNYQPIKVGWTPKREWRMLENMDGTANIFFRCMPGTATWYRGDVMTYMPNRMAEFDKGLAKRHRTSADFTSEVKYMPIGGESALAFYVRAKNMPRRGGKQVIWSQPHLILQYTKGTRLYVFVVMFRENVQFEGSELDDEYWAKLMAEKFISVKQVPQAVAAGGG